MLDTVLLVCALIAVVGTAVRIAIAMAAPAVRPRQIAWDEPTEAER